LVGCAGVCHKLDWESPYRKLSSLKEGDILHLPTGVKITKEQLINMLSGSRIVYVGEAHDNINSHKVQIEILKALTERYPQKIAVGMEMLEKSSQESADQWISGKLDEKDFAKAWLKDWGNDFQYYRSILHYVREHKIPLVALRAPDDSLERIKKTESTEQLKGNEKKLPEMDFEDPYHLAHTKAIFSKHPEGGQSFEAFYRVQVLWDEYMAESIAEYLQSEQGQDKRMLIFAGSYHVEYGFGIPRRVFRRIPLQYAIVLPMTVHVTPETRHKFMAVTMPEIPLRLGDFAWIISYKDLTDQQVRLGIIIRDTKDGVKVLRIIKDSTADKVGLKKDDIITALGGEPIKTTFDLTYFIGLKKPGEKGVIEVLRDKTPLRFEVTFQSRRTLDASP
jgi:uncharacterized iron-regulated protein